MQISLRAAGAVAFGLTSLLLAAGCGSVSGDDARATITPIQGSSYVTIEPATTTTPSTLPSDGSGQLSPIEQTYTVTSGDSLSKIASQYNITVDVLVNYNGWSDGVNHLILPGDQILIPPNTPVAGSGTETASDSGDTGSDDDGGDGGDGGVDEEEEEASSGDGCQHTIVEGDNPTRVARKYDITVEQLSAANATNPVYQTFLIGAQLTIPPEGDC